MSTRQPSRRALAALALVGAGCLLAVGCSGGSSADDGDSTTTLDTDTTIDVPAFSDPAVPITAPLGQRFVIVLAADPANGWRWVADGVNTAVLAPLGSEFREDTAQTTTTTTVSAPPDTTASLASVAPTTTVPQALVQLISYAGKIDQATTITLRYEQIVSGERAQQVTFQVIIGTPAAPPAGETTLAG